MKKQKEHSDKYKPTAAQIKAVLDFATNNKCVIDPLLGYTTALEGFNEYGSCVCDKTRPACPCTEALGEIAKMGHCRCHLFWQNYEVYIKAKHLDRCPDCNGSGTKTNVTSGPDDTCRTCGGTGKIKAGGN